ncbi:MAG: PorT family protein [Saprospiraceae bacterium]|nr:PorT family protein [Saprospiraceae bacterium]MCF8250493.1 PorT family protein [Saprospiraceae bacterium]MCF8279633.1 PorT family protein [Bacteroidales bacterium]MCF8312419.1 PorT family protein [Saprospiraceae bacterium]MCF8440764.1 PorT family protein [Saprospiraceae bacterium]
MKALIKILASALLLTDATQLLHAQTLGLGVRGGVNIATSEIRQKIDDSWDTDVKDYIVGVNAGLVVEIGVSDMFSIQPEVNYLQKGYKTTIENSTKQEFKTYLNYVEMPILLKGKFGAGDLKFNALLGPTFGYAFDGKIKSDDGDTDIDFDKSNIKQYDIGGMAGIGLGYDVYPGTVFLDARLGWGFTNLDDSDNSDNFKWRNRGFNIGIGYIYDFGY